MARDNVVIITGIAGGLARLTGAALHRLGYGIVGIDYRPLRSELSYPATVYQANYNKTKIEDIFRRHPPGVVLHLGRVGNLKERMNKRFDLNVIGSRKVMDLASRYEARRLVVLSTFHIYGAHPHNHIPIHEDEPLRAGTQFPQIADAIQLDNQAVMWIYRHPETQTVLLRPCNVIGADIQNAMSRFLRSPTVPSVMGFDPIVQFIHQRDLVAALVTVTRGEATGVYNVAGDGVVTWHQALRIIGARRVPVPSMFAVNYLRMARLVARALPPYLVNFFKYPCIISDSALRSTFGWKPEVDQSSALRATVGLD